MMLEDYGESLDDLMSLPCDDFYEIHDLDLVDADYKTMEMLAGLDSDEITHEMLEEDLSFHFYMGGMSDDDSGDDSGDDYGYMDDTCPWVSEYSDTFRIYMLE